MKAVIERVKVSGELLTTAEDIIVVDIQEGG